jgi:hypothetical protein
MRQNPRPSELPSKDDIEAAVQYVETKRRQMTIFPFLWWKTPTSTETWQTEMCSRH